MCVLAIVRQSGPTHGYEIAQRLRKAGLGEIKGGTLYPVLGRLEERGYLHSHWSSGVGGPGRKLVVITDTGIHALDGLIADWTTWTRRVAETVNPSPRPSGEE